MFAVLKTGGKQYKVAKNDVIEIERLPGEAGQQIVFDQILMLGDGASATAGAPLIAGASVAGTLLEQSLADKVIVFKKRRRHNYRRKRGHRQQLSVVRIDEILTGGAQPAAVQPAAAEAAAPGTAQAEA
jgi:large subunit ribosomal protein L21